MSDRIRIVVDVIDGLPGRDIYRSGGYQTESVVVLDPDARRVMIEQRSGAPGQGIPIEEWHGLTLTGAISTDADRLDESLYPIEADTRAYLRGGEGQALLRRICDGHERVWDGHNVVGRLTTDADAAWSQLQCDLAEHAREVGVQDAGDWYSGVGATDLGITAATSDEQIAAMAEEHEAEAIGGMAGMPVVLDGAEERLTEMRDALIADLCEEAEEAAEDRATEECEA